LLSDTAEYALRAVLYIAQHDADGPVRAKVVADSLDVPRNYLSKILHVLAREGILTSTRGGTGGFRLAHDPEELRLDSVVEPFEEIDPARTCILGRPECSEGDPCRAHMAWREITERKSAFLRGTTVADLIGVPEESEGEGATP
jgi:Rrf2 family protein